MHCDRSPEMEKYFWFNVFGARKKILGRKNSISIWHPPDRDYAWDTTYPKKFPNRPLECVQEPNHENEIPAKWKFCWNSISSENGCCSRTRKREWKRFLNQKSPAKLKYTFNLFFIWKKVTVTAHVTHVCRFSLLMRSHIVTGHPKRKTFFGLKTVRSANRKYENWISIWPPPK